MATFNTQPLSINDLPFNEPLVDKNGYITDVWQNYLSTLVEFISDNISQLGHFMPNITTDQRNEIQTPINGQIVADTTTDNFRIYQTSSGTWKVITIT